MGLVLHGTGDDDWEGDDKREGLRESHRGSLFGKGRIPCSHNRMGFRHQLGFSTVYMQADGDVLEEGVREKQDREREAIQNAERIGRDRSATVPGGVICGKKQKK